MSILTQILLITSYNFLVLMMAKIASRNLPTIGGRHLHHERLELSGRLLENIYKS